MVETTENENNDTMFDGTNWIDLNRMIALAKFQFLQDDDYDDNQPRRCAYLARRFTGGALDWVASQHATDPTLFSSFDNFITSVRQTFGVDDMNITAILRHELDALKWTGDVPLFFAEFDRLALGLSITGHDTKIAMVGAKLPHQLKEILAEQSLAFANYDTMRARLIGMWALDPNRPARGTLAKKKRKRGAKAPPGAPAKN